MGNVGGPRHHGVAPQAAVWQCPTCHAKNTSRFEDGCQVCGAGTPAMNAAAQVAAAEREAAAIDLPTLVLGTSVVEHLRTGGAPQAVTQFVTLRPYTDEARATVAAALAFAADNGMATTAGMLSTPVMREWARQLAAAEPDEIE